MVKYTLKQCAYFAAVAEHGGIAQAARELNISQPAVAQAIDKLEQLFEFRLFERLHARGTELTPQGRAFLRSARDLLHQAGQVEQDAAAIAAGIAGVIRLGCFHTIAPFYLAPIIRACRDRYPRIEVRASEMQQDELVAAMDTGQIDLAITYDMSLQGSAMERQQLARLEPFLLLPEDHPLVGRASLGLQEMAREPFVMYAGASSREYFEGIFARHGIDPPISFVSTSMESVRSAVANGLGFSISVMKPGHSATCDGGRVAQVPIEDDIESLAIVLLRRRGAPESRLIEAFCRTCAEQFTPG